MHGKNVKNLFPGHFFRHPCFSKGIETSLDATMSYINAYFEASIQVWQLYPIHDQAVN